MNRFVEDRKICYDFKRSEVDFLIAVGVWETIKENLLSHEVVTIEGYEQDE